MQHVQGFLQEPRTEYRELGVELSGEQEGTDTKAKDEKETRARVQRQLSK